MRKKQNKEEINKSTKVETKESRFKELFKLSLNDRIKYFENKDVLDKLDLAAIKRFCLRCGREMAGHQRCLMTAQKEKAWDIILDALRRVQQMGLSDKDWNDLENGINEFFMNL